MARYVKHFKTESEFNTERNGHYIEPWLSVTDGKGLNYNKPDYTKIPFTIEVLSSGDISWSIGIYKTIHYSKNGGIWEPMDEKTIISVVRGDEIQIKGTYTEYGQSAIQSTAQINVKGNIMSLIAGDNFETSDTVDRYSFCKLFFQCTSLVSASDLKLPATTLNQNCYTSMFQGCTNLIYAPELPATTLAESCYSNMFRDCTSLTIAPVLPATTLAGSCYSYMFYGCTSLGITQPILPATTLASTCYSSMFYGCISLTTAPVLPATTLTNCCYDSMFYGCTSLTTVPSVLPATTLADECYDNMFRNCTSLTIAPELPATTLIRYCYFSMFGGCTNLTTAPVLPATTLVAHCYSGMFNGCTSLNYIKAMFKTTPSSSYTSSWVKGVAATGTFVKNSTAQWTTTGVHGIPEGWTVQTATE